VQLVVGEVVPLAELQGHKLLHVLVALKEDVFDDETLVAVYGKL